MKLNSRACSPVKAWPLYAASLLAGVLAMSFEMVLGRTLTIFVGSGVETWAALIGVYMAGLAIGYAAAGAWAERLSKSGGAVRALAGCFLAAAALIWVAGLVRLQVCEAITEAVVDGGLATMAITVVLGLLPAVFLAAVSPLVVTSLVLQGQRVGDASGRSSALNTVGSIVGALGAGLFLVPTLGTAATHHTLAALSLLAAVALLGIPRHWHAASAAPLVVSVFLLLSPGRAMAFWPFESPEIMETVESAYAHMTVERKGNQVALLFGTGKRKIVESLVDQNDPGALAVPYTRLMTASVSFLAAPPQRMAILGLGGGRTVGYLTNTIPTLHAEVAEIDPEVFRVAQKYFAFRPGERIQVHIKDGRRFLQASTGRYDLILLDAYRGSFVPFHLTTKEFFSLVKSKLAPGGVVAQNADRNVPLVHSVYLTMRAVFDHVDVLHGEGNMVFVAYDGLPRGEAQLAAQAAALQKQYGFRHSLTELIKLRGRHTPRADAIVLTDDRAPVEMLVKSKD